jgi:hypothetical protein
MRSYLCSLIVLNVDSMHIPNCSIIVWRIDLTVVVTKCTGGTVFMIIVTVTATEIKCGGV